MVVYQSTEDIQQDKKAEKALWSPIVNKLILFVLLGYFLYFLSYVIPQPDLMSAFLNDLAWMLPSIKSSSNINSLRGGSALPSQVIILYTAFGSIFLSLWCIYKLYIVREFRERLFMLVHRKILKEKISRAKLIFNGMTTFVIWAIFPTLLFIHDSNSTSWQAKLFFSSSIGSITFLLFASLTNVVAVLGLLHLYFGFSKRI